VRGHVSYVSTTDQRVKTLQPTTKLLETLHVWFSANLDAVQSIEPLPLPATELAVMPKLMEQVFTHTIHAYIYDRFILSENFPPVRAFMQRNHGYQILMALIQSRYRAEDGRLYASVPVGDLAARLLLSRGTVRNILTMAQEAGWLTRIGRGGHDVELHEGFVSMCDNWMALELTWMAGVVRLAYATLSKIQP
jgi:hypothetical protein